MSKKISKKELRAKYELDTYLNGLIDAQAMTKGELEKAIDYLIDYTPKNDPEDY
jgi:hypothetical protein